MEWKSRAGGAQRGKRETGGADATLLVLLALLARPRLHAQSQRAIEGRLGQPGPPVGPPHCRNDSGPSVPARRGDAMAHCQEVQQCSLHWGDARRRQATASGRPLRWKWGKKAKCDERPVTAGPGPAASNWDDGAVVLDGGWQGRAWQAGVLAGDNGLRGRKPGARAVV